MELRRNRSARSGRRHRVHLSLRIGLALWIIAAGAAPARASDRIAKLERWVAAIKTHEPGRIDAAAAEVATWSSPELRLLLVDTTSLVRLVHDPSRTPIFGDPRDKHAFRYGSSDLRRLRGIAQSLAPDANRVAKRGALLHTDIAIASANEREAMPAIDSDRASVDVSDGRTDGGGQSAVHWDIARALLDLVVPAGEDQPHPERDPMVRQWYRAISAIRESIGQLDTVHFDRAAVLFPDDGLILFLAGCVHERLAAPHLQSAIGSTSLRPGVVFAVESQAAELHKAEGLFRRALVVQPDYAEARTRLGRVLGLLGHHDEAARELRQAMVSADDMLKPSRYFGDLLLGKEEEALGRFDAAREAFADGASLYPGAQSPLIALSALGWLDGDRAHAVATAESLFALPPGDDPWWTYLQWAGRDSPALLDELWASFRQPGVD